LVEIRVKAPAVTFLNWFNYDMPLQEQFHSLTNISRPLAPSGIQTVVAQGDPGDASERASRYNAIHPFRSVSRSSCR
jgi:hypothetical protein